MQLEKQKQLESDNEESITTRKQRVKDREKLDKPTSHRQVKMYLPTFLRIQSAGVLRSVIVVYLLNDVNTFLRTFIHWTGH